MGSREGGTQFWEWGTDRGAPSSGMVGREKRGTQFWDGREGVLSSGVGVRKRVHPDLDQGSHFGSPFHQSLEVGTGYS